MNALCFVFLAAVALANSYVIPHDTISGVISHSVISEPLLKSTLVHPTPLVESLPVEPILKPVVKTDFVASAPILRTNIIESPLIEKKFIAPVAAPVVAAEPLLKTTLVQQPLTTTVVEQPLPIAKVATPFIAHEPLLKTVVEPTSIVRSDFVGAPAVTSFIGAPVAAPVAAPVSWPEANLLARGAAPLLPHTGTPLFI